MSNPDFKGAQNKILDGHKQQMIRYESFIEKHHSAGVRAWELHLQCYYNSNAECVHEYNQFHLQHHRVSREKLAFRSQCFKKCKEDYNEPNNRSEIKSMQELNQMKEYYGCMRPCVEQLIQFTLKEIDVLDRSMENTNRFLKSSN
ncbi:hypothetical protein SteCoe_5327 [Stentor coeruleus]|uniref:Uncharacterized protein n=1 Tax=Stentor coeruleus TaxID=5963 RepID=A0A1R2CSR2_9CILI|nr:hypothetical protein SteCoe_5327 [Stentor coeruleus]